MLSRCALWNACEETHVANSTLIEHIFRGKSAECQRERESEGFGMANFHNREQIRNEKARQ